LLLFLLLRTWHLQDGTLSSSLLDLLDDFLLAVCSVGELVFYLGLLGVELLLLFGLDAFNLLLMLLIVGLCFLLLVSPEGRGASHLVFNLGLNLVKLFFALLSLACNDLLNLLVVSLGLLLDGVELLDMALLSDGVFFGSLTHNFLFLSSFLRRLALSNKLHLVVVIFGFLLDVGQLDSSIGFSYLKLLSKAFNGLLTKSALHG